ncbi:MAG TPA: tyrosine-protein phosphatase [Polyangiaceae bacterium]|nr:tyrosine-protein phosphatase [Polyangiaceae bacterium]
MILTSESHPIRVDFVELVPDIPGQLGMTFAPGKHHSGKSGRWRRDLDADLRRLVELYGLRVLVSLMGDQELARCGIAALPERCTAAGVELWRHPIVDVRAPSELAPTQALVARTIDRLRRGDTVVVHCLGGLGRTGTIVACVLVALGASAAAAVAACRKARPGAVEVREQEDFVAWFERGQAAK